MGRMALQAKQAVFDMAAQRGFVDPLTGEPLSSENELSSILAIYHQLGGIRWKDVAVSPVDDSLERVSAGTILKVSDLVCAEYPLIATDQSKSTCGAGCP